jgi:sugar phosphate isomerase/epimerase
MPTIAVSTFSFGPQGTAREGLDFAIEHGFCGLELGSWNFWPERMSAQEVRYMRVQAASHGIEVSIHHIHRGVAPATHDLQRRARHLEEMQGTLRLAGDIGARVVVVHPGPIDCAGVAPTHAPETIRQQAIDNLRAFLEASIPWAEDAGAVLCVENLVHEPGYVMQSYRELVDLVRGVDSPLVRIILDIGHADCSDGVRPAFEAFAPYLRHMHVHDSDGQRDHYEIGKATLDFTTYLDVLKPFPFTLAMETRDEQDPVGCVLRSRDALKGVLQEAAR